MPPCKELLSVLDPVLRLSDPVIGFTVLYAAEARVLCVLKSCSVSENCTVSRVVIKTAGLVGYGGRDFRRIIYYSVVAEVAAIGRGMICILYVNKTELVLKIL
jgi:hypothetical protein